MTGIIGCIAQELDDMNFSTRMLHLVQTKFMSDEQFCTPLSYRSKTGIGSELLS